MKNSSKNRRGFTLIEVLSIVVILGVLVLFIAPRLSSLIKNGGKTEKEVMEAKILSAAKEYVNAYDRNIYD